MKEGMAKPSVISPLTTPIAAPMATATGRADPGGDGVVVEQRRGDDAR